MNFIRAVKMTSPSGASAEPRIKEVRVGNQIHTEAHWYDPNNGTFFHKGTISIRDAATGKPINENAVTAEPVQTLDQAYTSMYAKK